MKAMIFAAGLGTRLGKITESMPKALVLINGKTMLQLAVERCALYGFDDIIVNVHHFAEIMMKEIDLLCGKGFRITVSDERNKLLDTGGGLFNVRKFFGKEPFLIHNVDIISDLDIGAMLQYHYEKKGIATLVVRDRPANRVYLIDESGRIRGWYNRTTGEEILTGIPKTYLSEIAFSGIHILEPEIFNHMREGIYSLTSLYLELAQDHEIFTYRDDSGFWADIGTPENLENIQRYFKTR
jgi:N-acetyl-alpha-D-muramate 1-phosphate uridylyltransferase